MEIVKTIFPHSGNSTHDEEKPLPESLEWLREMDPLYFTFLMLSCGFCLVVIVLAGVQLYYVIKYVSNERIRTDLYYLVLMFPITTLCSVAGMFILRAAIFLYAVALVYFMFCLFVTVTLLFNIFGSRRELAEYCKDKGVRISFRVPPVCCLHFLPEIESTDENLRRIEWLVFQTPILRTTLELISVVVFMELNHRHNLWFMFSQLFGLISMCIAFYGCYVIVPLGRTYHAPYKFDYIFRVVDIAQCIYTIQKFCFDFGAAFEIIAADRLMTASAKAQFWSSFMLTWEMMLLSALSTYSLRPTKSIFFDKYPVMDSIANCNHAEAAEVGSQRGGNGSTNTMNSRVDQEEEDVDGFQEKFDAI